MAKEWGVNCASTFCVCLAKPESQYCAVHAVRGKDFRVLTDKCEECDGTGECESCVGTGLCECECGDEHDCHDCDGSGDCAKCEVAAVCVTEDDKRYLAFAFDAGWIPPRPPFDNPWDAA